MRLRSRLIFRIMNLLITLYGTYAPTGREWPMICLVREFVAEHAPDARVDMDDWGNLYITKGGGYNGLYPTLCCHLDQVKPEHSDDFEVREDNGTLYGWSESRRQREALGADDKNGIWVCLKALVQCSDLKVFMSVGEEKGCWGSNRARMQFFADSLYVLEPDCKGGSEIRTVLKGVPCASSEFEDALHAEQFGYTITEGKTTDILPLTLSGVGVSCANIPVGYYTPHKPDEYCNVAELQRCLDFVLQTVQRLTTRFPHTYITETRKIIQEKYGKGIDF